MKSLHIDTLSAPWMTAASWKEANRSIRNLVEEPFGRLSSARSLAWSVRIRLERSFNILNDACLETCPYCPDPCCLKASPWFDYRDLIYLHLNELAIPPGQPIADWKTTCRYYHPRGCILDRISRPWICTWYLCPVQTAKMRNRRNNQWSDLVRILGEIKTRRKAMENAFIRAIT
jgi:hypothetical protein